MPHESKSSPREIQNYLGRVSGPLLDRIDLHIEVPPVKFREMSNAQPGKKISGDDVSEAIQFRTLDRQLWG